MPPVTPSSMRLPCMQLSVSPRVARSRLLQPIIGRHPQARKQRLGIMRFLPIRRPFFPCCRAAISWKIGAELSATEGRLHEPASPHAHGGLLPQDPPEVSDYPEL